MRRLLIVLATAAGCASGSTATQDTAPTTNTAATTSATTEPAPQTTTTAAPTTTSTTTTTTTTISPATTIAPTTTIDPIAQITADIERDLNLGEQAYLDASANPGSPQLRAEVEKYFGARSLEAAMATLDRLEQDGHVVRQNADVPATHTLLEPARVDDVNAPTRATVIECRINSAIVVLPGSTGDVIINDDIIREIASAELRLTDGIWRLQGGQLTQSTPGVTSCDD